MIEMPGATAPAPIPPAKVVVPPAPGEVHLQAVVHYWKTRSAQRRKLEQTGKTDQGLRSAVTGGAQLETMDATVHRLINGDARDLSFMEDESVHLVVTSPPYWNLKRYKRKFRSTRAHRGL